MWDPVAMLGNLSGFIPGINLSALPTLPNVGLPTISLPTFPVAAPPFNPASAYMPAAAPAPAAKPADATKPAPAAAAPVAKPEAARPAAAAPAPAAKATAASKAEVKVAAAAPVVVAAPVASPAVAAATTPAAESSKVVLAGDALFVSGKSGIKDLSKDGKARLDEVIAKIKAMGSVEQIKVIGHADPTGNAKANRSLSEARAKSVKSYLVAKGVKPALIITSGMGDTQPVTQCDKTLAKEVLKECHAPNRRVELEIIGKSK